MESADHKVLRDAIDWLDAGNDIYTRVLCVAGFRCRISYTQDLLWSVAGEGSRYTYARDAKC